MRATRFKSSALVALLFSPPLLARHEGHGTPAAGKGFRVEAVSQFAGMEKKLVDLAGVTPADKFAWRPRRGSPKRR